jgi:hypothetical protein
LIFLKKINIHDRQKVHSISENALSAREQGAAKRQQHIPFQQDQKIGCFQTRFLTQLRIGFSNQISD